METVITGFALLLFSVYAPLLLYLRCTNEGWPTEVEC